MAGVAAAVLVAAGCGGGSGYGGGSSKSSSNAASTTPAATGTAVAVKDNGKLGKILVDSKGNTLYLFEKDKTTTSQCAGACASDWPPLLVKGKPTAGDGAMAAKLGTTKRSDGGTQVTYNGHPVYLYEGDTSPGQATGQGVDAFGAEWYTLTAAGAKNESGEGGDKGESDSTDSASSMPGY